MEFTVGQLAKRANVNIETIRYYERRGLLPNPMKSSAGYRLYDANTVKKIHFIKQAQALGFTLQEILDLLTFQVDEKVRCEVVKKEIKHKIQEVSKKMNELASIKKALIKLHDTCGGELLNQECPILKCLEEVECKKIQPASKKGEIYEKKKNRNF
jgi:MerR family mercuric resistance operon transcriptional regulator